MAAEGPAGPVQVNVPFREPLLPDGPLAPVDGDARRRAAPVRLRGGGPGRRTLDDAALDALAARLAGAPARA